MRLIVLSCISSVALGGVEELRNAFTELGLLRDNTRTKREIGADSTYWDLIGSSGVDIFAGYGCWCHFGTSYGLGRGAPKDEVDKMCRVLAKAYQCAKIDVIPDGRGGFSKCEPWAHRYNDPKLYRKIDAGDITDELIRERCLKYNPEDECAFRTCTLDSKFIATVNARSAETLSWDSFLDFDEDEREAFYSNKRQHSEAWDRDVECPTVPSVRSGDKTRECCGEYPNRFPFMVAYRKCCGGVPYSETTRACCGDNKPYVRASQECCGTEPFNPDTRTCIDDSVLVNKHSSVVGATMKSLFSAKELRQMDKGRFVGADSGLGSSDYGKEWK